MPQESIDQIRMRASTKKLNEELGDIQSNFDDLFDLAGTTADIAATAVQPGTATNLTRLRTNGTGGNSQTINFNDEAFDETKAFLFARINMTGTLAAGGVTGGRGPIHITITDQANTRSAAGNQGGLNLTYSITGSGDGTKHATRSQIGVTSASFGDPAEYIAIVSTQSDAFATVPIQGATGGSDFGTNPDTHYKGGLFGGNDHPRLAPGATAWRSIIGREINAEIQSGASAFVRYGLLISCTTTARGLYGDEAIAVSNKEPASEGSWEAGLSFGSVTGNWPFDATSSIIRARSRTYPNTEASLPALWGVDLRPVTFDAAGGAFASRGFLVGPNGGITLTAQVSSHRALTLTPSTNWADDAILLPNGKGIATYNTAGDATAVMLRGADNGSIAECPITFRVVQSSAQALHVLRRSDTPASTRTIGTLRFEDRNSSAQTVQYANIFASNTGITAGAEVAAVSITGQTAGSLTTWLEVSGSGLRIGSPTGGYSGAGTINLATEIRVNGLRVVNARKTGWATATGTATRTTFATSTVTLSELAERVKALIDDLHNTAGHGLIGT